MTTNPLIETRPDVLLGKPVIRGTRISVEFVLDALSAGEPIDQILAEFPQLRRDQVLAAIAFAADAIRADFSGRRHLSRLP